jgi:hypothetical protein
VSAIIIFSRLQMAPSVSFRGRPGSIHVLSNSEWLEEDLFVIWSEHYILHFRFSIQNPIILTTDNQSSHTHFLSYNVCNDNGIIVAFTHRMQLLDVSFLDYLNRLTTENADYP